MTHRERYFLFAIDGTERTVAEIAVTMEIKNPVLVTQFLMRLKANLVDERSEWKLLKIMPKRSNLPVHWKLEKRVKITVE